MSEDAQLPPQETKVDTATNARDVSGRALREIALSFLRLGATAFGGPAAHIAMMEEEFVRRRSWVSHADFLDMLGASNLVPVPSSTEMAIHIGHQRAGWKGLVVAGVCFILPAMLIVMACAWAYATFGSLPQVRSVLYGVKPVIIAVVLQALWGLGRTAIKNGFLIAVGLLGTAAAIARGNVLAILLAAGLITGFQTWIKERRLSSNLLALPMPAKFLMASIPVSAAGGPNKPVGTVCGVSEIWRGHLRKRLCLVGVSSGRSRRSAALVDSGAASRRDRRGTGDTRPGLHHSDEVTATGV
jgi:chromate transporter